jgi:hypothetical protein
MKDLNIGITLQIISSDESIWTNGIKQNVLMLYHLLTKSDKKYKVTLLNTMKMNEWSSKPDYLQDTSICFFDDEYVKMDLIIVMGAQISYDSIINFKSIKKTNKVISYKCSFDYIITAEDILFKHTNIYNHFECYDELWYIPQVHDNSCGFFHTLYRTRCTVVPFIWHHKFLNQCLTSIKKGYSNGNFKKGVEYDCKKNKKVLGIMEPNINIVKFCLIPTMISEESYRGTVGKNKIEKLMITCSDNIAKDKYFLDILKTFDIYKDGKIRAESRYKTSYIVSQYLDIVISHQVMNPLNYLYLDVAYMGYPILHNASMCKDVGYYYEGSNTVEGAKMLDWILENHDNNLKEYDERNKKAIFKYSADNKTLIETYDKLLYNLYNGGNSGLIYDENTNNYK